MNSLGILNLETASPLIGKTFTDHPDYKKMLKMLYADDNLETKEPKMREEHIVYDNERKQIEDYLKLALISKKQGDRLGDKEFLKMLYHHTTKYHKSGI